MGKNLGLSSRIAVWLIGSPWFILGRSVTTLLRRWRSRRRLIFNWRAVFLWVAQRLWLKLQGFFFHPKNWGSDPNWRAYFSNGLVQPPTRQRFVAELLEDSEFKTQAEVNFKKISSGTTCDGLFAREHNPMTGNERKARNWERKVVSKHCAIGSKVTLFPIGGWETHQPQ